MPVQHIPTWLGSDVAGEMSCLGAVWPGSPPWPSTGGVQAAMGPASAAGGECLLDDPLRTGTARNRPGRTMKVKRKGDAP